MERTRNRLTIAICTALTAGALASAGAIAHDVDKAQASATSNPATSSTSATSSATTMDRTATDADQSTMSTPVSQSSTAGYGAGTNTGTNTSANTSTTTQPSQTSGTSTDASGDYDQSRTAKTTRSGSNAQGKDDVVWFVLPVAMVDRGDQMSNGCWVQLYSGDNFEGRYVSVVGPTGIRELRSPYGTGLNNWESAIVGPNATVTTYDDEDFRARNATLRAGQRYPDLDDSKLGLFDDIESIKVECSNAARSGGSN